MKRLQTAYERKTLVEAGRTIEGRTVTGFPSVFGNVDDGGDIVESGAFTKTLGERATRLRWLWQHAQDEPPTAKILEVAEVGRGDLPLALLAQAPEATGGLRVKREYLETPRGNEVLAAIQAGALNEMSFGYDAVKAEPSSLVIGGRKARRKLLELRLWEFSDVNWGMNPATTNIKAWLEEHGGERKALAEWFESRIHLNFTQLADDLFGDGLVTRAERIALSGLIGAALNAFNAEMAADPALAGVRSRERWDTPEGAQGGQGAGVQGMTEMLRRRILVTRKRLEL